MTVNKGIAEKMARPNITGMSQEEITNLIKEGRKVLKEMGAGANAASLAQTRHIDSAKKAVANFQQAAAKYFAAGGTNTDKVSEILAPVQLDSYRDALSTVTIKARKGGGGRPRKVAVAA